ncbi:MAG: HD domain-containing phosphohydrolase [Nitrospirota bacterium]
MNERAHILIVDDEIGPRESLKMILNSSYDVFIAENGEKAIKLLSEQDVDIVTLDLRMPGLQGTEVLREIKRLKSEIEVVIITGYGSLNTAVDGIRYGAADYLMKPFNVTEILSVIAGILDKKKSYDQLKGFLTDIEKQIASGADLDEIKKKIIDSHDFFNKIRNIVQSRFNDNVKKRDIDCLEVTRVLADILDGKEPHTRGHSSRVNYYSNLIAQKLELSRDDRHDLQIGAFLHDIGKIGVDNKIILKSGSLSKTEREIIKNHCDIAVQLLTPLELSPQILSIIRHHHEFYNGRGYPDGLKGDDISVLARIVTLADSFDTMLTDLPYKKGRSIDEALAEIKRCEGTQFDPMIVQIFLRIIENDRDNIIINFSTKKKELFQN